MLESVERPVKSPAGSFYHALSWGVEIFVLPLKGKKSSGLFFFVVNYTLGGELAAMLFHSFYSGLENLLLVFSTLGNKETLKEESTNTSPNINRSRHLQPKGTRSG